jgi:hypothetical protein
MIIKLSSPVTFYGGAQAIFKGDGVTGVMPKAASLLAILLTIALAVPLTGCIEAKDPPEHGDFLIEVHSDTVFFLTDEGGTLHGAHAHVETDLHHEHPEYIWTIGDQHFEGSDVEIGENTFGIEKASYDLDYYGEEMHIPVYVVSLDADDETWVYVADGAPLEHHENETDLPRTAAHADMGLEALGKFAVLTEFNWELMRGKNITEDGIAFNVTVPPAFEETTSYVFGIQWAEGTETEVIQGSCSINAGEEHQVRYSEAIGLEVTIFNETNSTDVLFEGAFEDLPTKYTTHIGMLEWEGEVGGEEEAPGMTAGTGLLALSVVVVFISRRRRR